MIMTGFAQGRKSAGEGSKMGRENDSTASG